VIADCFAFRDVVLGSLLGLVGLSLLAPAPAAAAPGPGANALMGVPVALHCKVHLSEEDMLFQAHDGEDIYELAKEEEGELEPAKWLSGYLCEQVWTVLEQAGAHPAPDDVRLPARAVVAVDLVDSFLEGTRTVDQRVGSSILPVSIPRWALYMSWEVRFHIEHLVPDGEPLRSGDLLFSPRGGAEQQDYTSLKLGSLLRGATRLALGQLPRWLADEGQLGDLLFAIVERPGLAPAEMGLTADLAPHFWLLLAPRSEVRHDALACHLGSDQVPIDTRTQLARWFLLNDSDLPLRRDALGWLMLQQPPADSEQALGRKQVELMGWLLRRDPSPRLRAEIVLALSGRRSPEVRDLLLLASADNDSRASDTANSLLRRFPAATTSELEQAQKATAPPTLPPWTIALDGRVPLVGQDSDQLLMDLALTAGGPAAETWLVRWLDQGEVRPEERPWALPVWERLSSSETFRVRRASLKRLLTEQDSLEAESLVVQRIAQEPDPALRVLAISGLERPGAPGATRALLDATSSDSNEVRAAAASALATAPGARTGERLRDLSRSDADNKVRRKARKALRQRSRAGL